MSALLRPISAQRIAQFTSSSRQCCVLPQRIQRLKPIPGPYPSRKTCEQHIQSPSFVCQASAAAMDAGSMPEQPAGGLTKMLASMRSFLFFFWSFTIAAPFFVVMVAIAPLMKLFDKHRRLLQHRVNDMWAQLSTFPFYRVQIEGRENLPPTSQAVVFVANHQSFLDIYSLFHLNRPFKFISKTSNFLIPIVGWSMFLTGHVRLNRVDRRSQLECLKSCKELLEKGASVLFFPEGTRSVDRKLQEFKKGAFSVAVKSGVPVVPVSLIGTGDLMQSGKEGMMFGGRVKIVVHPPIQCKGRDADEVCSEARAAVASALPKALLS